MVDCPQVLSTFQLGEWLQEEHCRGAAEHMDWTENAHQGLILIHPSLQKQQTQMKIL